MTTHVWQEAISTAESILIQIKNQGYYLLHPAFQVRSSTVVSGYQYRYRFLSSNVLNLRKEKELTTSGPYRYTRNPLYFGSMILGISTVVACQSWGVLAIFLANFLIIYPVVIRAEKEKMSQLFPEKYREYRKHVPLFFPTLKPNLPRDPEHRFSWERYKHNRENRAFLGSVIFYICLITKTILF